MNCTGVYCLHLRHYLQWAHTRYETGGAVLAAINSLVKKLQLCFVLLMYAKLCACVHRSVCLCLSVCLSVWTSTGYHCSYKCRRSHPLQPNGLSSTTFNHQFLSYNIRTMHCILMRVYMIFCGAAITSSNMYLYTYSMAVVSRVWDFSISCSNFQHHTIIANHRCKPQM